MIRTYNPKNIEKDFVDKDGWITDAVAEGGKKRLTFNIARHAYRRPPKEGNPMTSQAVYESLLEQPENVSVVLSDAPVVKQRYSNSEPYACVLASVCDAAGLIEKGRSIVCLTLDDYKIAASIDGSNSYYGWQRDKQDLYGSTRTKHDELARELVSAGAELVVAPEGWHGPESKYKVIGWTDQTMARDYAFSADFHYRYRTLSLHSNNIPIIDADTPLLRKIASSFAGDEAERERKFALSCSREVFKGLELKADEAVELLSYGMVGWEEAKSKSYKVPIWKKNILRPTTMRFPEFNGGKGSDDVAGKLDACSKIWQNALNAYGISFKEGQESHEDIVRVWKEIGTAIGVDSAIEAVLQYGVPVSDVVNRH